MTSVETKNIRQDSAPERGGENIERGPIINTGKRWRSINGYNLVKREIMLIYTNKPMVPVHPTFQNTIHGNYISGNAIRSE
jgi:hypothetical protein